MRAPVAAVAVAIAGSTLALAACGGGGLSHGTYVKRADAICSAYAGKVALLTHPTSYDEVVSYVADTLPLHVAARQKLEALKPAPSDRAAVGRWLASVRKVEQAMRTLRDAAMRHDLAGTNDASDAVQAAGNAARRAAAALGLQSCSRP